MYRLYRTKHDGPVMVEIYIDSDVTIEIMGKS